MAKRCFATAVSQESFDLYEKLGAKVDYRAGVSLAALTIALTAGFVDHEYGKLERKIDKVEDKVNNVEAKVEKPLLPRC
jgi:hypothetical protein